MNKICSGTFRWVIVLMLVFVVGSTSGCETLRKKFTRRKKHQAAENQELAILDPIDYPDKVRSAAEAYKEHYSLWKVWVGDLPTIVENNANQKKLLYTLGQIKQQLSAMRDLLKEEAAQSQMDVYLREVEYLRLEFQKSAALGNKTMILSRIYALGRNVRKDFAPQKVLQSLRVL